MSFLKKINYWRIIEPLLLGSLINITVNYFFNPSNPDFILKEFIVAIIAAILLTEISRKIDRSLEKKYSWTANFKTRFTLHLLYLFLSLLFFINVIGNIYIWISGDSFHTLNELILINSVVLIFSLLLTFLKWTSYFYKNWRKTEIDLNKSTKKFDELKSNLDKSSQSIELQKGNHLYKIPAKEIQIAKSEFGVITVYAKSIKKGIYNHSLSVLETLLPQHLFFRASRNTILHRDIITSVASSTYGKIQLEINESIIDDTTIMISRPKASSFRKWYHSTSV